MLIEQRSSLKGEIFVPGDKSISHRAVMFGSLAKGTTEIEGFLMSEDCLSTIDCFRKMHVAIEILPNNRIRVHGNGLRGLKPPSSALNTGYTGTALRLILGTLCGQSFTSNLTRKESAMKKSVGKVVKPLKQMGATIVGRDDGNLCPLIISPSKLKGITYQTTVSDAAVKSPLLIAGLYAEGETTVIEAAKSRDHTELMMKYFGANIKVDGLKVTSNMIDNLHARHVQVPGDISIASYFITAALLIPNSDVIIKNVGINPTRSGILNVYKSMGAKLEILNERTVGSEKVADIRATSSSLNATAIDSEIILSLIDEIPIIIVAATQAKGTTAINGLKGLKIKESGRIKDLISELSRMGASIRETEEGVVVEGGKPLRGTIVESHNDYLTAMSLSVAALTASGETTVRKSQVIDIAFPEFFSILNKM